jgi:predicted DNA binding CopG/RHH family protein
MTRYTPTAADRARLARQAPLPQPPDSAIDVSDAPELTDAELQQMQIARADRLAHLAGPAPQRKRPIAFRIDPELLAAVQAIAAQRGQPYQTVMHQMLADAVLRGLRAIELAKESR